MGACGRFLMWKSLISSRDQDFGGFKIGAMEDMENTVLFGLAPRDDEDMSDTTYEPSYPSSSSRCAEDGDTDFMVVAAANAWTSRMTKALDRSTEMQQSYVNLEDAPVAHRIRTFFGFLRSSPTIQPWIPVYFSRPMDHAKAFSANSHFMERSLLRKKVCVKLESTTDWREWDESAFRRASSVVFTEKNVATTVSVDHVWFVFVSDLESIRGVDIPKNSSVFLLPEKRERESESESESEMDIDGSWGSTEGYASVGKLLADFYSQ